MAMKFQELDKLETRQSWTRENTIEALLLKIVSARPFRNIEQSLTNVILKK
jgi:hypothetical protein